MQAGASYGDMRSGATHRADTRHGLTGSTTVGAKVHVSGPPGHSEPVTTSTLDVFDVTSLSEGELRRLSNLLAAELEQRARRDSDPAALVAEGS